MAAGDNSQILGISIPASVSPGQAFTAVVTLRNNGPRAWSPIGPTTGAYRLGNVNNATTWTKNRWELPHPVPAGGTVVVNVDCIAPPGPNPCPFAVQMLQEGVNWFGAASTGTTVAIGGGPTPPPPSGQQFPPCQPGDTVSAQVFVLNDPPPTMNSQVAYLSWKNNGPPMKIVKTYLWVGVDSGARADIHVEVSRDRDGLPLAIAQCDHYAEPTGPGDNCVWTDFPHSPIIKTGETLTLAHVGFNFNPQKPAHYGIRVVLYAVPAL